MSATVIEPILATCPGLQQLETGLLRQLAGFSRIIEVATDAVLHRQGTPPDSLHYLLDGQVVLSQTAADNNSAVIDVVHPVSSISLASVVANHPHMMTAQAMRPSRLLAVAAEPLRGIIATQPRVAMTMLQGMSADIEAATRQVLDLKLRNAAQRLGCFLLSLADTQVGQSVTFRLPYQKRLLAARLGCRHENLSRAFGMLRALGVETHGSQVTLHDVAGLRAFSVGDGMEEIPASAAEAFSQAFEL